ncbi:hypothetical protein ABIA96_002652 [Bradyrhizobium sp. LB11.1]
MADERLSHGTGECSNATSRCPGTWRHPENKNVCQRRGRRRQLTRFQIWPPQNMPPKAQPCTRIAFGPFMAIVES